VPSYILRDIPADLWRQVKVEAATEGVSVREVILRGLKAYAVHRPVPRTTEAVRLIEPNPLRRSETMSAEAFNEKAAAMYSPRRVSTPSVEPLVIPSKIKQRLHESEPSNTGRKRRKS
jgi:hypothetical protein